MAAEKRILDGELLLTRMARLQAMVEHAQGTVKLHVRGTVDEAGRSLLRGHVNALISMQCQRCMQPVPVLIDTDFLLAVVDSESEVGLLPDDYEPLLLETEDIALAELIEDELLLSLPIVARHELNECATDAGNPSNASDGVYKPFVGLADLLAKRPD